jgi:hypothetical protein
MKNQYLLLVALLFCFNASAQETREDWSKRLKQPNLNIEGLTAAMAKGMSQPKGQKLDQNAISLGSSAVKKNIYIDFQFTSQAGEAQIELIKNMMPKMFNQQVCATPVMFVLVKEHGVTVSYRWFDQNMKELLVNIVDSKNC